MNMPQTMTWPLARRTAQEAAKPLEAVELVLSDAAGFALASGVRALASQPTCDTSAMDGYAVAGPGPWTVVGRVAAGDPVPDRVLRSGEAFGVATGAAVACPDRKVICMVGDGSAMYTLQSLWTQAREGLDITTIVFANRTYQILRGEFDGVGAGEPGQRALDMLSIDRPTLDWVSLAKGMGVAGRSVSSADDFNKALEEANSQKGPRLIEVQM